MHSSPNVGTTILRQVPSDQFRLTSIPSAGATFVFGRKDPAFVRRALIGDKCAPIFVFRPLKESDLWPFSSFFLDKILLEPLMHCI